MNSRSTTDKRSADISKFQTMNWPALGKSKQLDLVTMKATEGIGYVDPQFRRNAAGAEGIGIPHGFYHFARPDTGNSAAAEAKSFIDTVKPLKAVNFYALDMEGAKNEALGRDKITAFCAEWSQTVYDTFKKPVLIYSSLNFVRNLFGPELAKWPLWVADPDTDDPGALGPWKEWAMFQYSWHGHIAGIGNEVDLDAVREAFFLEVTGQNKKTSFDDVPAGYWAEDAIAKAAKKGILTGIADNQYGPEQPFTRAQIAVVLDRLGLLD